MNPGVSGISLNSKPGSLTRFVTSSTASEDDDEEEEEEEEEDDDDEEELMRLLPSHPIWYTSVAPGVMTSLRVCVVAVVVVVVV